MLLIGFVGIPLGLFCVILIAFTILQKRNRNSKSAVLQRMRASAEGRKVYGRILSTNIR